MPAAISDASLAVLQYLNANGPRMRSEIATSLAEPLPPSTISNLQYLGHIESTKLKRDSQYSITARGQQRLRRILGNAAPLAGAEACPPDRRYSIWSAADYKTPELRPCVRPGATDALRLPSRMFNRLHWPDGQITPITSNPTGEIHHG